MFDPVDGDTTTFHGVVNADMNAHANATDLLAEEEHEETATDMVTLMDILQSLGVKPENACCFASAVVREKPRFAHLRRELEELQQQRKLIAATSGKAPTFIELYGRAELVKQTTGADDILTPTDSMHLTFGHVRLMVPRGTST